jgi:hypothetical protein
LTENGPKISNISKEKTIKFNFTFKLNSTFYKDKFSCENINFNCDLVSGEVDCVAAAEVADVVFRVSHDDAPRNQLAPVRN